MLIFNGHITGFSTLMFQYHLIRHCLSILTFLGSLILSKLCFLRLVLLFTFYFPLENSAFALFFQCSRICLNPTLSFSNSFWTWDRDLLCLFLWFLNVRWNPLPWTFRGCPRTSYRDSKPYLLSSPPTSLGHWFSQWSFPTFYMHHSTT